MPYRYLPLSNGLWTRVSTHRYEELSKFNWFGQWDPKGKTWYAYRSLTKAEGRGPISLHRHIMGCTKGDGREVDHIDSKDTLNNQDDNLRFATRTEQNRNRGPRKDNTSGYRGVVKDLRRPGYWKAQIWWDGKNHIVWRDKDPAKCHEAYKREALLHHGKFARFD